MGKKTNWTTAEDQTLCRVWMNASDLKLQGGDQKASNFWNAVRELFHQEIITTVERPLNGLKVRWTRINKDSQKFACILNEIQTIEKKVDERNGSAAVALFTEQQWIDEAKDAFYRHYNVKFSFEGCWKQLRYSSKWLQLFANSTNHPISVMDAPSTSTMVKNESGRAPSTSSSEDEISTTNEGAYRTATDFAPPAAVSTSMPNTNNESMFATATAAINQTFTNSNVFAIPLSHKRPANVSFESLATISNQQLQELIVTWVEQLKRQNDLMVDQNAIALLRIDGEMLSDAEAQQCFETLRARYFKKVRRSYKNNNSRSSTLV
ncbi:hypothetical protein CCR75_008287 [Bremia lactucae]|uniref:Uncharacterized protein n=1 Tax=Bremia lactucae TaxID=4779 RepID=A0A976FSZ0_BRELC|nr:hypothetical protein CCR75_009091 [Bremia lactucae]TDH71694.1 hypothetical protein CCR75_008287 [Bremia lactucae]